MGFLRLLTTPASFLPLSVPFTQLSLVLCNFIGPPKKLPTLGFLSNCLVLVFLIMAPFLTDFGPHFLCLLNWSHILITFLKWKAGSFSLHRGSCEAPAPHRQVNPASASTSIAVTDGQTNRKPHHSRRPHQNVQLTQTAEQLCPAKN